MHSANAGAAHARVVTTLVVFAGLALAVGCARYHRKPLLADEYQKILESRVPTAAEVSQAIDNAEYAPADGLMLDEAELLALYLNPRLRTARQAANVSAASARHAGLWDDPEIGADALRILEDVEEPWIAGASLSFSIPISGRLAIAKKEAQAEALAALVEAWSEEQQVLLELREAWAGWESASASLAVSQELFTRLQQLVALTNRREELGEMIAAEAVAFRLSEARIALDLATLRAGESAARLRVIALMGLLPNADVTLVASRENELPTPQLATERIYSQSPEVLLAAARYEAAEQRLRLEFRKQFPDITFGPLFENEEGMDRLGIGVSVPIPILNANRQEIATADASREQARAKWEQAVEKNLARLAEGTAALEAARHRHDTLQSSILPLANQQMQQARRLADLGEINTLLILEALQSEREAALDAIAAQADIARAIATLHAIVPERVPTFTLDREDASK